MRYEAPESLEGAMALLAGAKGEARVLAGGTDRTHAERRVRSGAGASSTGESLERWS